MRLSLFAALLCATATLYAHADTTVTHTGTPYGQAGSPFTGSDFVSGTFSYNSPLAPNLNGFETVALENYSFTDGPDQFVYGTPLSYSSFSPATDANGNLLGFYLNLQQEVPASVGSSAYYSNTIGIEFGKPYASNITADSHGARSNVNVSSVGGAIAVTSTAVTPEPSSFALLGTGLLGLAGIARKQLL